MKYRIVKHYGLHSFVIEENNDQLNSYWEYLRNETYNKTYGAVLQFESILEAKEYLNKIHIQGKEKEIIEELFY